MSERSGLQTALISAVVSALVAFSISWQQGNREDARQRAEFRRESYARFYSAATDIEVQATTAAATPPIAFTAEERDALRPLIIELERRNFELLLVGSNRVIDAADAVVDSLSDLTAIDTTDPFKAAEAVVKVEAKSTPVLVHYQAAVQADLGLDK